MWNIPQSLRAKVLWAARVNSVNIGRHRRRDALYLQQAVIAEAAHLCAAKCHYANLSAQNHIQEANRLLANCIKEERGTGYDRQGYIILP